jgi:hypothetical protein
MENDRPRVNPALISVVVFCLLVGGYIVGYFWCGKVGMIGPNRVRTYSTRIEAELFGPCALLESQWTGRPVYVGHSP